MFFRDGNLFIEIIIRIPGKFCRTVSQADDRSVLRLPRTCKVL